MSIININVDYCSILELVLGCYEYYPCSLDFIQTHNIKPNRKIRFVAKESVILEAKIDKVTIHKGNDDCKLFINIISLKGLDWYVNSLNRVWGANIDAPATVYISPYLAALNIPFWTNNDFIVKCHNKKVYLIERRHNAFNLLNISGYVQCIDKKYYNRIMYKEGSWKLIKPAPEFKATFVKDVKIYIEANIVLKPNKLEWRNATGYQIFGGAGWYHENIFLDKLDPVEIKNGVIVKNEENARLAKYMNQEYGYVVLN